jgi:hypothetical protein
MACCSGQVCGILIGEDSDNVLKKGNQIKEDDIDGVWSTCGRDVSAFRNVSDSLKGRV